MSERWPAALNLAEAAEYCGLSTVTFKNACPVKPICLTESTRGNRWLRTSLDTWLAAKDPNRQSSPTGRKFGERLGGQSAPART